MPCQSWVASPHAFSVAMSAGTENVDDITRNDGSDNTLNAPSPSMAHPVKTSRRSRRSSSKVSQWLGCLERFPATGKRLHVLQEAFMWAREPTNILQRNRRSAHTKGW